MGVGMLCEPLQYNTIIFLFVQYSQFEIVVLKKNDEFNFYTVVRYL